MQQHNGDVLGFGHRIFCSQGLVFRPNMGLSSRQPYAALSLYASLKKSAVDHINENVAKMQQEH